MLKVTLLGLGVFVGSLFAQDNAHIISNSMTKNYHLTMLSKGDLSVGDNKLIIQIDNKSKAYAGMDVNLTLYTPDNQVINYEHLDSDKYNYLVNTNLANKGEYKYVIKFSSQTGGYTNTSRGSFDI